jgi:KipI family sensor histidine kinase inhibitor
MVVRFQPRIDPLINSRALDLAETVSRMGYAGIRDVVPTYCAVTIYFDPLRTDVDALIADLHTQLNSQHVPDVTLGRRLTVPVCYGGEFGPDLSEVARHAGCSEAEVIALHAAREYRVYMLGFLPGFAYMGIVDERIAMPRRDRPRLSVRGGSIGIAGCQTGVYPMDAPGGWRLIGRTPVRGFDLQRDEPFFFRPGDMVRFEPVGDKVFHELKSNFD